MIIGWCFICVFAVLINKVCLQVTVEAVIGGSVVLPCSSAEHDLKLQDTVVYWRHNDSEIVCDIVKGQDSVTLQNHQYKNRVKTFPDEYNRGNFSIKLNNLTHTDAGEFICLISQSSDSNQETVQLIIKGHCSSDKLLYPKSWYFICVFAVLINKVCLQVTVEAVIGGSVVLPCSSTKPDLKLQDTDVHWRHNDSRIVYDIAKGQDSVMLQDQQYENRVKTFPDEYNKGNFSIKLINLTHTDAGEFICLITDSSDSNQETVQLIIKESVQITECHNHTVVEFIDQNQKQWQTIIIIISALLNGFLIIVVIGLVKVCVTGNRNSPKQSQQLNTDQQQVQVTEQHQDQLQYATMDFSKLRRNIRSSQINSTYAALNLPKL
ncbi:V-set domain-containing T-cell activation inhibitor 1-like protein [Labeo rohita]|uniref:V-set domain-containing T-cell activation inhibitor 1-like protein n=1 Tax=Labeo rohita TaxID=84645 RepID=A0A498MG48_LABRO|nr:V-set domain-containing T-cell activation inhibitor 1-like protein [Labeo rohita]